VSAMCTSSARAIGPRNTVYRQLEAAGLISCYQRQDIRPRRVEGIRLMASLIRSPPRTKSQFSTRHGSHFPVDEETASGTRHQGAGNGSERAAKNPHVDLRRLCHIRQVSGELHTWSFSLEPRLSLLRPLESIWNISLCQLLQMLAALVGSTGAPHTSRCTYQCGERVPQNWTKRSAKLMCLCV
jgi:hypothetical protein